MTDRPILFSAPMVRALVAGTKTQTRRALRPQPPENARYSGVRFANEKTDAWFFRSPSGLFEVRQWGDRGDRLWVREAWCVAHSFDSVKPSLLPNDIPVCHTVWTAREMIGRPRRCPPGGYGRLRLGMFMPRWASRLTLVVAKVRIERLQNITEADAIAEGVVRLNEHEWHVPGVEHPNGDFPRLSRPSAREMYAALWDAINGSGAWLGNPWVVATTFTVHHCNIDQMA